MDPYIIIYYTSVFAVAALAGTFKCVNNGDFRSVSHCISVAGISGAFGFGVVSVVGHDYNHPDFNPVLYLGISTLVGMAGRQQTAILDAILKTLLPLIGQALAGGKSEEQD